MYFSAVFDICVRHSRHGYLLKSLGQIPACLAANCGTILRTQFVVKLVNFGFHFGWKTDAVQFIAALQPANDLANFGDLANAGTRIAVFNVDATLWLGAFGGVVVVIRHVAGAIFDEVVIRIVACFDDTLPRFRQKLGALV